MFSQVAQVGSVYQIPPSLERLQWCKVLPDGVNDTADPQLFEDRNFDRLLPTIFECFAIVFCGFIAGRCNLVPDIKGLHDFTTYFSLPPLIFLNLVTINFQDVQWLFVASILLSKFLVFGLVVAVTTALGGSLAYAGVYAIFCTQGNDFGLAYPIVASLYGSKQPLYPGYMYLIAPTSLLFLNPIGFLLMEANKEGGKSALIRTATNILRNPVVFVTLLGVLGNFLFHGHLPSIFFGILQILSSAFSAGVLFLLGFSVAGVGDSKYSKKEGLLIPSILIITKMLVSPLVTRSCVSILCSKAEDQSDLSDYGFLYGMVPTGPIVMLFATQYGLRTEMMASTMVVCTAVFGPAVFILAKMVSLEVKGLSEFSDELQTTMLALSAICLLSATWISLSFVIGSKTKQQIYKVTLCLIFSQAVLSLGVLVWTLVADGDSWMTYVEVGLISGGQLMSRMWSTVLALTLLLQRRRPKASFVTDTFWANTLGFGFPLFIVLVLLILTSLGKSEPDLHKVLPLFIYGEVEAVASAFILLFCLTTIIVCLVLHFRSDGSNTQNSGKTIQESDFKPDSLDVEKQILQKLKGHATQGSYGSLPSSETSFSDKQLLDSSDTSSVSSPVHAPHRKGEGRMYLRHVIFLILISISMALGLTISTWKLSTNQQSGLFLALEFLDAVLNVGQGILLFIVFIKDTKFIINPIARWLRKVRHGVYSFSEEDDPLIKQLCHQFATYHRDNCLRDLPRSIKKDGQVYDMSFTGSELTEWLMRVGLAAHRSAAEVYAQRLMSGEILCSSDGAVQFHDSQAYLYRIT